MFIAALKKIEDFFHILTKTSSLTSSFCFFLDTQTRYYHLKIALRVDFRLKTDMHFMKNNCHTNPIYEDCMINIFSHSF